jgi:subtilisin family serine protease
MHHRMLITFTSCAAAEEHTAMMSVAASSEGRKCTCCKHIPVMIADLDEAACETLRNDPSVVCVEPDGIVSTCVDTIPVGITAVRAPEAHAQLVFGTGVKVAVIDTGIDSDHPDLEAIFKGGINFVTPGNPPEDDHNHGTHVSGILAAVINDVGILGMAPNVDLYAVKVLNAMGSGSFSNIILAYDWCVTNGMQVTNNSYGSSADPGTAFETAFNAAHNAGIMMICAAGNSGPSADSVIYPAKFANAVAVSAIDTDNVIAFFSSRGPEVEICAPGVNVNSTLRGGQYGNFSGTSMACPHVAGACALALSKGLPVAEVRTRLTTTCVELGVPDRDDLYGFGRLDAFALAGLTTPLGYSRCATSAMWV